jgi:hypothetical protein
MAVTSCSQSGRHEYSDILNVKTKRKVVIVLVAKAGGIIRVIFPNVKTKCQSKGPSVVEDEGKAIEAVLDILEQEAPIIVEAFSQHRQRVMVYQSSSSAQNQTFRNLEKESQEQRSRSTEIWEN